MTNTLDAVNAVFSGSNFAPESVSGGFSVKAGKTRVTLKNAGVFKVYFPESLIDAGAAAMKAAGYEYIGRVKNAAKFKGDLAAFPAFAGAVASYLSAAAPVADAAPAKPAKRIAAPVGSLADKPRDARSVEAIADAANARKALPAKRA